MPGAGPEIHRREVSGHRGVVLSVAWSPSGRKLASGADDATVRIWDITPGIPVSGRLLVLYAWAIACTETAAVATVV